MMTPVSLEDFIALPYVAPGDISRQMWHLSRKTPVTLDTVAYVPCSDGRIFTLVYDAPAQTWYRTEIEG